MTHPTDDELEELAVEFSQAAELSCFLSNDEYRRTAAMLRACKGRPAPDHSEWNAAIEAAAKKCETHGVLGGPTENKYAEWKTHADNLAAAIRALKKGQTND